MQRTETNKEKVKVLAHMANNQLFSKQQFGFLPGRSTLLQLLLALEDWMDMLEKGFEEDVIYMDFCKAFDEDTHSRLLDVLRHYSLHQKVLNWVKDFLLNRKQSAWRAYPLDGQMWPAGCPKDQSWGQFYL
jgi:hypothetical protein